MLPGPLLFAGASLDFLPYHAGRLLSLLGAHERAGTMTFGQHFLAAHGDSPLSHVGVVCCQGFYANSLTGFVRILRGWRHIFMTVGRSQMLVPSLRHPPLYGLPLLAFLWCPLFSMRRVGRTLSSCATFVLTRSSSGAPSSNLRASSPCGGAPFFRALLGVLFCTVPVHSAFFLFCNTCIARSRTVRYINVS